MPSQQGFRRLLHIGWFLCASLALPALGQHAASDVLVVAHSSVQIDTLSRSQLRRIFTLRQSTWPQGVPITVVAMPDSNAAHQVFCKKLLRLFPYQLERTWDKVAYSGLGERPLSAQNSAEMIEIIRQQPGSVGYLLIDPQEIPEDVHVIHVNED
ncbi:hypothetical protein LJ739_14790 [Aestuariibacter halophilus]|uniref:PBP domain-containing protein n=1 Tax=Fluctibacter halophilus TaxID=226011 RepID=A0ABS8GAI8_9ALTE|nr:hypothetical protein [Aestuariibacter halophilus]MCC2617518.1 hypothetical protein [Aestuariibacter halophilus]